MGIRFRYLRLFMARLHNSVKWTVSCWTAFNHINLSTSISRCLKSGLRKASSCKLRWLFPMQLVYWLQKVFPQLLLLNSSRGAPACIRQHQHSLNLYHYIFWMASHTHWTVSALLLFEQLRKTIKREYPSIAPSVNAKYEVMRILRLKSTNKRHYGFAPVETHR